MQNNYSRWYLCKKNQGYIKDCTTYWFIKLEVFVYLTDKRKEDTDEDEKVKFGGKIFPFFSCSAWQLYIPWGPQLKGILNRKFNGKITQC